jgi:BON domain
MQKPRQLTTFLLASMLLTIAGCKTSQKVARTDQQMESDIQSKLAAENTLQGKDIGVAVAGGVATLNGTVDNDDMRALAGTDAGSVAGVKTVVNDLTSASAQAAACVPPPRAVRAHLHVHKRYAKKPAVMSSYEEQAPPPPPDVAPLPPAPVRQILARPAPVAVIAPPPPIFIPRPRIYAYAYGPGICCRPVPWVRPIVPVRPPVRVYVRPY